MTLGITRDGTGPPLVLLHGLGAYRGVWEPVTPLLRGAREVIAFDLPGFGDSPPLSGEATPRRLADAVTAELRRLGIESYAVAGNSLGGWVAMEMAIDARPPAPNCVAAIAPAGLWRAPLVARPVVGQRIARTLYPLLPFLVRSKTLRRLLLSSQTADPLRIPRDAVLELLRRYATAPGLKSANDAMRASNFTQMGEITVPLTLIWPQYDRLIARPRQVPPQVEQTILPGCGHLPMWDDPAAVAAALLSACSGDVVADLQASTTSQRPTRP